MRPTRLAALSLLLAATPLFAQNPKDVTVAWAYSDEDSWSFVDELVKADKPFDLMVYPMRKHPIEDRPARIHLFEKMLEFWKLYL
jgi:hypothetical protein